ncbi:MAG: DMT family transporter [Lachnospiraceae bacterium]|nr:DMT family transporter [Lachnospiraceae bacterium]
MKTTNVKSSLQLFLAALIWGVAFVAQSVGMEYVGPFTFNAVRSLIGGVVLIPCILYFDKKKKKEKTRLSGSKGGYGNDREVCTQTGIDGTCDKNRRRAEWKVTLIGGICCGICLCIASNLQQIGITYTTVGKAGFITAMYIVLVPILGIFLKKRTGIQIWISVAMAVAGLYLLCMTEQFTIGRGDIYVLMGALVFAFHILTIDYFAAKTDGVKMSCVQFLVSGGISSIFMLLLEHPQMSSILAAWMPILYAGIMSCGVAYTLQIIGQKNMDPTVSSLILSLESVVSVLAGWVLLGQKLSIKELVGCTVMFGAIILAQLPERRKCVSEEPGQES